MPHEIKWEKYGVYIKFSGHVTMPEVFKVKDEIYGDERFDTMPYQIPDFSDVEYIKFSESDVMVTAMMDCASSKWNGKPVKVGIVSGDNQEIIRAGNEYAQHIQSIECTWGSRLFKTLDAAREWINQSLKFHL